MPVALIGSSGGGTATLGHTDPVQLLKIINDELAKIDSGISAALFVSLDGGKGMDTANPMVDHATLYAVEPIATAATTTNNQSSLEYTSSDSFNVRVILRGTLVDVNQKCQEMDRHIAQLIESGDIQGLVCISCHVGIHEATLRAAAKQQIPVTGSGGSSLSKACTTYGIRLVGNAGGSVATTSYTRAVSYTCALATSPFQKKAYYRPWKKTATNNHPNWKSVLNSCLPAFWAVCLLRRFLHVWILHNETDSDERGNNTSSLQRLLSENSSGNDVVVWFHALDVALENFALPVACAIVMATAYAPHHGSTVLLAASVAAMVCRQTVLGGLIAGWLVGIVADRVMYHCIARNVPATMTNLLVAGGVGGIVAIVLVPVVPWLRYVTVTLRWILSKSMNGSFPGLGFTIGCLFCYGSKVGYYHALCLPVILLEMETGKASLWGAVDELTLVLVSAGICAANLLTLPSKSNNLDTVTLCQRGFVINLLCGDFIEACYPYMDQYTIVNIGGYLGSGLSTAYLVRSHNPNSIMSLAYLPWPVSVWLAKDRQRMICASMIAMGVPFFATVFNNMVVKRKVN